MTDGPAAMLKALMAAFLLAWTPNVALAQSSGEIAAYQRATTAMRSGDWRAALLTAESASPVARDIIEWHRLRNGGGDFDAVQRFLERNPDWPGLKLLRRRGEAKLPLGARADEVIAYFRPEPPQTGAVKPALPLDRESDFDTPHLNNIYDSAPYLHNGIAETLEEIWTRFNPYDEHGVTNDLTKDELNHLIEYLKTL